MDTTSCADMPLAKRVLYGMYADTAARGQPQVLAERGRNNEYGMYG